MSAAFVEVLKYISKATKQATIKKAEVEDELEKARSGIYKNNAENIKKQRVGQEYGNKKQDDFVETVLTNFKQRLLKRKAHSDLKTTKSGLDYAVDKFLELLKTKKIKFNGKIERFRYKDNNERKNGISFQSVLQATSFEPRSAELLHETEWWNSIQSILQEEIVREQAKRQGLLIRTRIKET